MNLSVKRPVEEKSNNYMYEHALVLMIKYCRPFHERISCLESSLCAEQKRAGENYRVLLEYLETACAESRNFSRKKTLLQHSVKVDS